MCRVPDLRRRDKEELERERDALRQKNAALLEENQHLKVKVAEGSGEEIDRLRRANALLQNEVAELKSACSGKCSLLHPIWKLEC